MSERGESTAALMPKAVALTSRAPARVANSVVFFISRAFGSGFVARWRRVACAGSVSMMARDPNPICRRARTRAVPFSEAGVGQTTRAGRETGPCMMLVLIVPTIPGRLLRRGGLRVRSDGTLARLRIGDRLVLGRLRFLLACRLVRALLVVALLLRDVVVGVGFRLRHLVLRMRRALSLRLELGLGDILLALGLGHADVLAVAAHRLAIGLRGLVVGFDAFLVGAIVLAHRRLGVLHGVGEGAARRRVVRLRRGKCRRTEQESPAKGGVKSGHSHVFCLLMRFQSLDESLTPGLASLLWVERENSREAFFASESSVDAWLRSVGGAEFPLRNILIGASEGAYRRGRPIPLPARRART